VSDTGRFCMIVGCGKPDALDPKGGTWPTCNATPPLCLEHASIPLAACVAKLPNNYRERAVEAVNPLSDAEKVAETR
jgi:hypothetical protein